MKERNDCKIVQDLLPIYIEKLTNKETNQYIEEHLNECEDCKKIFENMQESLKLNNLKRDDREVKYIKKFNKKIKTLKFILLMILVIFILIIWTPLKNFMIFTDLNNKNKKQQSINNIYGKVTTEQATIETYIKDDVEKIVRKGNDNLVFAQITKPQCRIFYIDNGVNKKKEVYQDNETIGYHNKIQNLSDYVTLPEKIWSSICSKIKTETIDGQEYYVISGNTNNFVYSENTIEIKDYINKNTGLTYKIVETVNENGNIRDKITTYEYQFGIVTDEDVAEPEGF